MIEELYDVLNIDIGIFECVEREFKEVLNFVKKEDYKIFEYDMYVEVFNVNIINSDEDKVLGFSNNIVDSDENKVFRILDNDVNIIEK